LIEANGGTGMVDNAEMPLTPAGHQTLRALRKAGLRVPCTEFSHLVLAF
jgi:hypothetical protein